MQQNLQHLHGQLKHLGQHLHGNERHLGQHIQLKQLHTQQRGAHGTAHTVVVVVVVQTLHVSTQQWQDIYLILFILSINLFEYEFCSY